MSSTHSWTSALASVAAAVALLVATPGTTPAPAAASTAPATPTNTAATTTPPLSWHPCPDEEASGFDCATMPAPLDYDVPGGQQIDVAVIRKQASDQAHRLGTILFNPGGPGGSGLDSLPEFYSFFPAELRARYDIVSFDPRGIGSSDQLQCFASSADEDALLSRLGDATFPTTRAEERTAIDVYRTYARACATHGGVIQDHMGTADVARDMDRIRAAIGEPKLDYYGPSYGTYLGATYVNLFPHRVHRVVLDGNVPPVQWNDARDGARRTTFARIESAAGAERGMRLLLSECGRVGTDRCAFSAGSPAATTRKYLTLLDRLKRHPVTVGGQRQTYGTVVHLTGSLLVVVQPSAELGVPGWRGIADTIQQVWQASSAPSRSTAASPAVRRTLAASAQARSRTGLAVQEGTQDGTYGVLCGESPNPRDITTYFEQARELNREQSPLGYGYPQTYNAGACPEWQGRDQDVYRGPWNRSPVPILVIGTKADSNTAYSGSVRMARQLGNARLLTETGGGHTALLNPSTCVNDLVSRYFTTGALPARGTVCHQDEGPF